MLIMIFCFGCVLPNDDLTAFDFMRSISCHTSDAKFNKKDKHGKQRSPILSMGSHQVLRNSSSYHADMHCYIVEACSCEVPNRFRSQIITDDVFLFSMWGCDGLCVVKCNRAIVITPFSLASTKKFCFQPPAGDLESCSREVDHEPRLISQMRCFIWFHRYLWLSAFDETWSLLIQKLQVFNKISEIVSGRSFYITSLIVFCTRR